MVGTELCAQPAYEHIDGAGAAVVVVAPDLLQQLRPREDAAGVLGEVLQQLELLERQVEHVAAQLRGVRRLVDAEVAGTDDVAVLDIGGACGGMALERQTQAGVDLGGTGSVEDEVLAA